LTVFARIRPSTGARATRSVDGRCVAQATSWVTVNTSVAFAGMLLPGGDKGKEGRDSTCGLMVTVVPSA